MYKYFNLISEAQKKAKEGGINSIPWLFSRLTDEKFFPGWVPGKYYSITANSSVGKTKFLKYLTIYTTYVQWMKSGKSFDFKIMWFALEESEEEFWLSMICLCMYIQSGGVIQLTPSNLLKQGARELSKEELKAIKRAEQSEFLKVINQKVSVFDNIFNPTGIKIEVERFATQPHIGVLHHNADKMVSGYTRKSDNLFLFVVTDHISLLHPERSRLGENMTERQTLKFYSESYCLNVFCKRLKAVVINSHQQDQSKENLEFTNRGMLIEQKLEPSLDHLANNKELQRDYDCVVGLFNPIRYEIVRHNGYEIAVHAMGFGKNYRGAKFLKDRLAGLENVNMGLYFNGVVPYFEQLPKFESGKPLIFPSFPTDPMLIENLIKFKQNQTKEE
jgi:hypothetical protein